MMELYYRMRNREEGQALVEYALILSLVSVATLVTLGALGVAVDGILQQIVDAL